MIVAPQCMYLDRHLWQVPGNVGLMYPQTDAGPAPPTPSEPVYIDMIYPPRGDILVRRLWVQASNILPPQVNYKPVPPEPGEPIYVNVPLQLFEVLGKDLQVTFDGHTVADWLWKPTKQRLSKIYPSKILPITYPAKYPRLYP